MKKTCECGRSYDDEGIEWLECCLSCAKTAFDLGALPADETCPEIADDELAIVLDDDSQWWQ